MLCALFIKRNQLQTKPSDNDSQPEALVEKHFETNHSTISSYPVLLALSSDGGLHYQKVEFVLSYQVPNKLKNPEGYAHHLLFVFYPICYEREVKVGQSPLYFSKLSELGVLDLVNNNKSLVQSFSDLVNVVFLIQRAESLLVPPSRIFCLR